MTRKDKESMKKLHLSALLVLAVAILVSPLVEAKRSDYVYRSRANWVKLIKLSTKQLAGQTLNHPYQQVTVDQMTAMLQSLHMNKKKLFKKEEFKTSEIFSPIEARKYAPLLVKALEKASPNEVVNMAVVHRRPYFVLRNDFISILNVFAGQDGVHFYFSKLFARLDGDYQQASNVDKSIRKAKSIRVSLDAREGQILTPNGNELILNPTHNYGDAQAFAATEYTPAPKNVAGSVPSKKMAKKTNATLKPEPTQGGAYSVKTRLQQLESLKAANLISTSEYKRKRSEILNQL